MSDTKFGLLRGLSDIYICEIEDNETEYKPVGTPQKLIPAGELTMSKSVEKTQTYFDNALYQEVGKEAPTELSIVGAAVRSNFLAWVEGKNIDSTTGAVLDNGDWKSKFYAICGKRGFNDGTSEYFWFHKCSFNGAEETGKTADDSTDAAGMTLPFTAYKTTHKFQNSEASKLLRIDTTASKLKADAEWFAQVITPDNLTEFVEKVTETATAE